MKTSINKVGGLLLATLFLVSCGAKKVVSPTEKHIQTAIPKVTEGETFFEKLSKTRQTWTAVRVNAEAEISVPGKKFSSRLVMQVANGKGLRISVIPFPLVEAVRIWFNQDGVTIVDRINGRYVQESYATLSDQFGFTVDYDQIQSLFLGQVFAPGIGTDEKALSQLKFNTTSDQGYDLSGSVRGAEYTFHLDSTMVLETIAVLSGKSKIFDAQYSHELDGNTQSVVPYRATYTLLDRLGSKEKGKLRITFLHIEKLDSADGLDLDPKLKSKYERITLSQVLKMISGGGQ